MFQKYDLTPWVKELLNVAHTLYVVSTIQFDVIRRKCLLWDHYLKNWYI